MLVYFPEPYPNEDFRSVIFRYHHRSGNVDMKDTKKELFDIASGNLRPFPRNISSLLKKLPVENCALKEKFLSCTWFSLFKPFLSKERLSLIEMDILYGKSQNSYVGRIPNQRNTLVLSKTIKYCIICMQEDFKRNGEIYVHLEHQIDFLDFCPTHFIKLDENCPKCSTPFSDSIKGVLSIKPCCYGTDYQKIEKNKINKFKLNLFSELQSFKNHAANMESHILYAKIIAMLGKNGYIDLRGYIKKRRIINDLVKYYQVDCLNSVSIFPESLIKRNNQYFLNHKYMSQFIILYILLILFLEGSIKSWTEQKEYYSVPIPFGIGPWPCYNPVCPSFQLYNSINKCKRTITEKNNIGRFICPICGFEYIKKESPEDSDNSSIFQLEKWGFLWESKVQELYNNGYKVKEIADLTGSPKRTIRECLNKFKNDFFEDTSSPKKLIDDLEKTEIFRGLIEVAASCEEGAKKSYRDKIINYLQKSHGNLTRMDVRKIAPKEYLWILKNDKKWLKEILPPVRHIQNYELIDVELKFKVRKAAEMVLASNPSFRIRKYNIMNILDPKDKNRLLNHKEKLPKTIAELDSHIESVEDYQVRHIPIIVSQLKSYRYVNGTLNSILAFRRSYRNCSEETKQRIVEVLEKIQKGM
ncbi:TnsD family Tn7-like transposition protein [Ectobacillus polymachus]|uniref:TnsD family Tn7-like transposition protein n=1 Tax=Ectobacillus polymachus TaxID=1508806 RepID=UPI003A884ED1